MSGNLLSFGTKTQVDQEEVWQMVPLLQMVPF
jgi:hypothetical protein